MRRDDVPWNCLLAAKGRLAVGLRFEIVPLLNRQPTPRRPSFIAISLSGGSGLGWRTTPMRRPLSAPEIQRSAVKAARSA